MEVADYRRVVTGVILPHISDESRTAKAALKARACTAADSPRSGRLAASPAPKKCGSCDYRRMCTAPRRIGL